MIEWVRGLWAARSQLAAADVKKRSKYGRHLGKHFDSFESTRISG